MTRWLMVWLGRILFVLAVVFVASYSGDWAIYKLRGSPQSSVTVNRFVTIPLKGNKSELDYLGTSDVSCSVSLFPQSGQSPCWQLRRNTNQGATL
jgi:hypothetical protein